MQRSQLRNWMSLGLVMLVSSALVWAGLTWNAQAITSSNITYGPYLQRVTKKSATVLIATDSSNQLQIQYHQVGKSNWRQLQDSTDRATHRFRLTKLRPGKIYEYFLEASGSRLTQTYQFATQRKMKSRQPLRAAVVGDAGLLNTDALRVAQQMLNWEPDLILHTGDVAYTDGTREQFITNFFKVYQPVVARWPIYPSIGNHDYQTDAAGPYKDMFELPQEASGNEDYYSFNYDLVHFVALNTNLDYSPGSTMYNWLVADLAGEVDDTVADDKWIIVYFHHPPYSSGSHGGDSGVADALVPVFEQYGVDLVLNGHDHDYERSKKTGITYIVTGGGGGSLYSQENDNPYSQVFESEYHFTGLTIRKNKIQIKAIDKRGYIFDTASIIK